jgi:hypothetical protein
LAAISRPLVPSLAARGLWTGCGRERHLAARVGTFRNSTGNSTINLWHQPNWLQCSQGAKVRNWTPIQNY